MHDPFAPKYKNYKKALKNQDAIIQRNLKVVDDYESNFDIPEKKATLHPDVGRIETLRQQMSRKGYDPKTILTSYKDGTFKEYYFEGVPTISETYKYEPLPTEKLATYVSPLLKKEPTIAPKQLVSQFNLLKNGIVSPMSVSAYDQLIKNSDHVDSYKTGKFLNPDRQQLYQKHDTGGDISLNSSATQIQGNPGVTDGNNYNIGGQQVALDHNEVLKNNFVFSDSIHNPLTGKKFSEEALVIEKKIGRTEKILAKNPHDVEASNTLKYNNIQSQTLAALQEKVATQMGHRNGDGSTVQDANYGGSLTFAKGGPVDPTIEALQKAYALDFPNVKFKVSGKMDQATRNLVNSE